MQEIIEFSKKRVYLSESDTYKKDFPDLELPEPIFGYEFAPIVRETVEFQYNNNQWSTQKYYGDFVQKYTKPSPALCKY